MMESRSIAIEPKSSRPTPANAEPQLVDRTHSNPAVTRRCPSQTQSHGQGQTQRKDDIRVSDLRVIDRDSRTSIRDAPFSRSYQSPQSTHLAAELRIAHGVVNRNEDVCSPLRGLSQISGVCPGAISLAAWHSHADCLISSPARMQICLRSISLCWEPIGSGSQPSFREPWIFERKRQQHGQARRCPWTA